MNSEITKSMLNNISSNNNSTIVAIIKKQVCFLSQNLVYCCDTEFTEIEIIEILLSSLVLSNIIKMSKNEINNYTEVEILLINELKERKEYFELEFFHTTDIENIFDLVSIQILKTKNGEKFLPIIKKYYKISSSEECFTNMLLKFKEQTLNLSAVEQYYNLNLSREQNLFKKEAESLFGKIIIGTGDDFVLMMKFIKKIMTFQCKNIEIEHILHLVLLSNSKHVLSMLNGITYSMNVTESLDFLEFWKNIFLKVDETCFQAIFQDCLNIPVFKSAVINLISKYIINIKRVSLSEYNDIFAVCQLDEPLLYRISFVDIMRMFHLLTTLDESNNIVNDILKVCPTREIQLIISNKCLQFRLTTN